MTILVTRAATTFAYHVILNRHWDVATPGAIPCVYCTSLVYHHMILLPDVNVLVISLSIISTIVCECVNAYQIEKS